MLKELTDGLTQDVASGTVNEEGFINYYLDFNCVLPVEKETYFVQTVTKSWGLDNGATVVSPARIAQLEGIIYEKIR